ncbi:hypothetical protein F4677DRAFT_441588 [Hypoxylon crocopeplum]|nr:hypothetical protein F4677DRAFT_441588 [Hypoxylon crocopeplum]
MSVITFNPYRVLRLEYDAGFEDIEKVYRQRCRSLNPRQSVSGYLGGGTASRNRYEELAQVKAAYDILTNVEQKPWYDYLVSDLRLRRHVQLGERPEDPQARKINADGYESSEYEEEGEGDISSEVEFRPNSRGKRSRMAAKFRSRVWATYTVGVVHENLCFVRHRFTVMYDQVQKLVRRSDRTVWGPLENVRIDICLARKDIEAVKQQVANIVEGWWKNTPAVQHILATLYRLETRAEVMIMNITMIEGTFWPLKDVGEVEQWKDFKKLLRAWAPPVGRSARRSASMSSR